MLWFVEPLIDWEDAEHIVGAIGGLFDLGVGVYRYFTEKDEEEGGDIVVGTTEDGTEVPLGDVLKNHEERLEALEARPAARARKSRKAARR